METTSAPPPVADSPSFLARHQFLIYRLFSLSGLIPVGAYLCIHLITNATILDSPATFQSNVDQIHSLGIFLPIVEWLFIFLPILFHATVGWLLISGMVPNTMAYPYPRNRRYLLQRVTGIIAFFFIFAHVIHLHHLGSYLGGGRFEPEHASSSAGEALQAALWLQIFYGIGVVACVYHFANGLWTQGMTWGIWISPQAQRRATWFSVAIGILLGIIGLSALWGMRRVDVEDAKVIEKRMIEFKQLERGEKSVDELGRSSEQR